MANLNDGYEGPPAGSQVLLQSNCHRASLETCNVSCSFAAIRRCLQGSSLCLQLFVVLNILFSGEVSHSMDISQSVYPLSHWTDRFFSPYFLATVNKNPENTLYTLFFFFANLLITSVYISLGKYLGMPLLSQRECTCLNTRNFQTFFRMVLFFLFFS